MFQRETWRVAIDSLRANKLRAFLTMLGVVIGSACIVLVITVSLTGSHYIIGQIEGVGANLVYGELVRSGSRATTLSDEITLADLRSIEEAPSQEEMRRAVAEVRDLVRSTLQDVRQLAVELRPKALDDFGLVPALERLTESFAEQTGISVEFETAVPDGRLPAETETALYRIVQESLTNIVKHARASRVSVVLTRKDDSVSVIVEDDGVGFEPGRAREGGLGLVGMRERVGLLGGRLTVESRPGAGTTFVAEVPVR